MRYNKGDQVRVFAEGKLILLFNAPFTMCDIIGKRIAISEYNALDGTKFTDKDLEVM